MKFCREDVCTDPDNTGFLTDAYLRNGASLRNVRCVGQRSVTGHTGRRPRHDHGQSEEALPLMFPSCQWDFKEVMARNVLHG